MRDLIDSELAATYLWIWISKNHVRGLVSRVRAGQRPGAKFPRDTIDQTDTDTIKTIRFGL